MKTELHIIHYLRSVRSLLNGRLRWGEVLDEVPMDFFLGSCERPLRVQPEIKAGITPGSYRMVMDSMRMKQADAGCLCMLIVPFLSPAMIELLDAEEEIAAVDVCGNGIIKTSEFYVCVTRHANRNAVSAKAVRPFKGRSVQAALVLMEMREWPRFEDILGRIRERGGQLSLPQLSKAIRAYEEMDIVRHRRGEGVFVLHPSYLLDQLLHEWEAPRLAPAVYMQLRPGISWEQVIQEAREQGIRWCYSPESSLRRYAVSAESGAAEIWTGSPAFFEAYMEKSFSPAFAQYRLCLTADPLAYFQSHVDVDGECWSGPIAACIVATRGDARQRNVADDVYQKLVKGEYNQLINKGV